MALDWKIFTQRPYIKSLPLEEQTPLFYIANEKSIRYRSRSGTGPTGPTYINLFSLNFDGNDDIVDTNQINLGLENTISFWGKSDGIKFNGMVWGGVAQSNYYTVFLTNSNRIFYRVGGGANQFTDSDIVSALGSGNWFHCALVRNNGGADVLCYINGDLKQTITGIVGSSNDTIIQDIGARTLNDFFIKGNLDELSVFNSALSSSDITSIYNLGTPNDISSLSPLSWYRFEEGSGTTATDSGTGGNNGTISGATYSTSVPT